MTTYHWGKEEEHFVKLWMFGCYEKLDSFAKAEKLYLKIDLNPERDRVQIWLNLIQIQIKNAENCWEKANYGNCNKLTPRSRRYIEKMMELYFFRNKFCPNREMMKEMVVKGVFRKNDQHVDFLNLEKSVEIEMIDTEKLVYITKQNKSK